MFDTHGVLLSAALVGFVGLPIFFGNFFSAKSDPNLVMKEAPDFDSIPEKTLVLGFVGDIMLDRGVRNVVEKNGNDYSFPFSRVAPSLRLYDVLFGNLEGTITDRGTNVGSKYSFRMAPSSAQALKDAGFDILSVANNHSGDWSLVGMTDTWKHIRGAGILPVGGGMNSAEAYEPVVVEEKGVRIAYVAFSEFGKGYMEAKKETPGIAIISSEAVEHSLAEAKRRADIVVASFHFGEEYETKPNEYQKRIAQLAVDAGADIVVGHHPHVRQPLEWYKDSVIAYSLGNFVFDQNFSDETMEAPLLTVLVERGRVTDAYIRSARMDRLFRPGFSSE